MSVQANQHIYSKIDDYTNKTLENILTLDSVQYFRDDEINEDSDDENEIQFDVYSHIFNITTEILETIPFEIKNNLHVNAFIEDIVNNIIPRVNDLLNNISNENVIHNLKQKFVWILLLHCVKSCPPIIRYLLNCGVDKMRLISEKDNNGNNILMHSLLDVESFLCIIENTSKDALFVKNNYGICPLDMIVYNGAIHNLIDTRAMTYDEFMCYNIYGVTPLHMSVIFENNDSINYLLNHRELKSEYLSKIDCNLNTPAMIAMLYKKQNIVDKILDSPKFTIEAFSKLNSDNKNIFSYKLNGLIEKMFINKKFTNEFIINNYNVFMEYFESNVHKINEILCSEYCEPLLLYRPNNNLLSKLISQNSGILLDQINKKNEIFIKTFDKILNTNSGILSFICQHNLYLVIKLIDLNYVSEKMLLEKRNHKNTIESLIDIILIDDQKYELINTILEKILSTNNVQLINYLNVKYNEVFILVHILNNFPQLFFKLINDAHIVRHIQDETLLDCLKVKNNLLNRECIIKYNLINVNTMKQNKYETLKYLLQNDIVISHFILNNYNNILDETSFIDSSIIEHLKFINDNNLFHHIINHPLMTTYLINKSNVNTSILYSITEIEKLKILLSSRSDFNRKLLFDEKWLDSLMTNNNEEIIVYIMEQPDFPYTLYQKLIYQICHKCQGDFSSCTINYDPTIVLNAIINHNYAYDMPVSLVSKILMLCISGKLEIFDKILNAPYMSREALLHKSNNGNNILLLSLMNNFKEKEILSHKLFDPKLFYEKNKDNVNAINLLENNLNYSVLEYSLKNNIINKNVLTKSNNEKTILHKMIEKNYIKEVFSLVHYYNDKHMLFNVDGKGENIMYHICNTPNLNISCQDFIDMKISVEDLMININEINLLFKLFDTNYDFFVEYIKCNALSKQILMTLVPGTVHNFISYALLQKPNFAESISIDTLVDIDILNIDVDDFKLMFLIIPSQDLFIKMLNHPNFNQTIFTKKNSNNQTYLEVLYNANRNLLIDYFQHEKCCKELLMNNINLIFNICKYDYEILMIILNNELLPLNDINLIQLMIINSIHTFNNFRAIINSKYYNNDIFDYNSDIFMDIIIRNNEALKYLLENNKISLKSLFGLDRFGDPLIVHLKHDIKNIKYIFENVNADLFYKQNKCGQTILHQFANEDYFRDLVIMNAFGNSNEIFEIEDNFGNTYLDYIVHSRNEETLRLLINKNMITKRLISHKNKNGKTCFSKLLISFPEIHDKFKYLIDGELLNVKDNTGLNNFANIIKYSTLLLKYVLSHQNLLNDEILNNIDNKGRTCLMIAAQYNAENLVALLNHHQINLSHFMVHHKFGSCLTKAIKYNPRCVKYILENNKFGNELLYSRENDLYNDYMIDLNIVQLACKYNPEALMFILSCNKDIVDLVREIYGKNNDKINSLKLAILYQPECVEILLKSKYGCNEFVKETNTIMDVSCVSDALYKQPASLQTILKSEKFMDEDIHFNNVNPTELLKTILNTRENIPLTTNFYSKIPLMKYKNDPCDSNDHNCCTICACNKSKVYFAPCGHKSCVLCALRISKCHICRSIITNKIVIE